MPLTFTLDSAILRDSLLPSLVRLRTVRGLVHSLDIDDQRHCVALSEWVVQGSANDLVKDPRKPGIS